MLNMPARELGHYLRMLRKVHSGNLGIREMPYRGPADLLLREGRFFRPCRLAPGIETMMPKLCYANAYELAWRLKRLTYVEGFATSIIPVEHAWCVDADGNVVDPTWTGDIEGRAYCGLPLKTAYVRRIHREARQWGALFNWKADYPLCTGAHSLSEAVPRQWRRDRTCPQ